MLVSAALARAADAAYASVRDPAEGTMLTAVRAMAHRVAHDLAHMETRAARPGRDRRGAGRAARRGARARARGRQGGRASAGPSSCAVLREAGVVDAGAYGLTVIIAGVLAGAARRAPRRSSRTSTRRRALHRPEHESRASATARTSPSPARASRPVASSPLLEEIGDSVLVVGDDRTLRVHVHTDEPERAVALFDGAGEVSRLDVADMHEQVAERTARLARRRRRRPTRTLRGRRGRQRRGHEALYEELGAHVVDGGATMNPSTYELLAGIHAAPRRRGDRAAEQPQRDHGRRARRRAVGASPRAWCRRTAPQEGLAALLAFDPRRTARGQRARSARGAEALRHRAASRRPRATTPRAASARATPSATPASELVAWGDPAQTLAATLAQLAEGAELSPASRATARRSTRDGGRGARCPAGVELEYHEGGQPAWWWLLCAE